LTSKKNYNV